MQIVIDGRMILSHMTGVGRYVLGLTEALAKLPGDARYELWLSSRLPAGHPAWKMGTERLDVRQLPLGHMDPRQQWKVPLELRRRRPDLFHYPHFDLPWLTPGRIVATIHDLKYLAKPNFFSDFGRARRLIMLTMMRFTIRRADRIIAVSHCTRRDLIDRLGAAPEKIRVIPEGVEERFFRRTQTTELDQVRQRYGLNKPYLLCVAERRPHKNLPGLLHAFHRFRRAAPVP